jgi:4-hydroxybenzoate polyprenyltransferase
MGDCRAGLGGTPTLSTTGETRMMLIIAIVLLVIAIAGGVIIHPLIFALAIVALVLFFTRDRV